MDTHGTQMGHAFVILPKTIFQQQFVLLVLPTLLLMEQVAAHAVAAAFGTAQPVLLARTQQAQFYLPMAVVSCVERLELIQTQR